MYQNTAVCVSARACMIAYALVTIELTSTLLGLAVFCAQALCTQHHSAVCDHGDTVIPLIKVA